MRATILFLVLIAGPAWGQAPTSPAVPAKPAIVELSPRAIPQLPPGPLPLSADRYRWFFIKDHVGPVTWELENEKSIGFRGTDKPLSLFGRVEGSPKPDFHEVPAEAAIVWGIEAAGPVKLSAFGVVNNRAVRLDTITLMVGPRPPPEPEPNPEPTPTDNPLPSDKLRRLIVFDTSKTYSVAQVGMINSALSQDYIKQAAGEWRTLGVADDASALPEWWRKAKARAAGKTMPFVIISSPKGYYEGSPATHADELAQLKKLGG